MSGVGRFSVPLARPLATADGTIDRRKGVVIRLGDKPAGVGEATPLPGWTEPLDTCLETIESVCSSATPLESPADLPDLSAAPAARHGLELALLDRAAKAARIPLYRHLGGERRVSSVPVNATVGDGTVDATVAAALEATSAGFRAVKVKVGARGLDEDLARVAAVRKAVGERVELRVDANGAWNETRAAAAVDRLATLDVSVVEQPVEPAALSAHTALKGRGVDIAVDESLRDRPFDEILDADAADVLVLKPMVLGGVGRCARLAERAAQRDIDVIVTTTFDAAVARTAAVHLAAAIGVDRACGLATADRLARDVASDPAPVVDGVISVPQAGGHGVSVEDLT